MGLQEASCQNCGVSLAEVRAEPRQPCPECGSLGRVADELVQDRLVIYEHTRARGYPRHTSRWHFDLQSGASYFRKDGEWHRLYRLIDRENDRYVETISRHSNGDVVRHVEEPLSSHTGRGSAKSLPPDDP